MKNKRENILVCPTAQYLEWLVNEKKINAIGFVKGGRKILEDQEHIFVEELVDCEKTIYNELSTEAKLIIWKSKHNRKGGI
jgi:hypothetical protein